MPSFAVEPRLIVSMVMLLSALISNIYLFLENDGMDPVFDKFEDISLLNNITVRQI